MTILYITQALPHPQDGGGKNKTFSTILMLKKMGHKVILFSFVDSKTKLKYAVNLKNMGLRIEKTLVNPYISGHQTKLKKLIKIYRSIFSLKPFSIYKYYQEKMNKKIKEFVSREKVDCIWIDQLSMSQYLPCNYKGLKILETQNMDSLFFKQIVFKDFMLSQRIFALSEWIKFSLYERIMFPKFSRIFTISIIEKNLLQKKYQRIKLDVLPPGIKLISPKNTKNKASFTILYIGNLCWYPNKDGMKWFLEKIYPLIQDKTFVNLLVIGKLPKGDIFTNSNGVKFLGFVKDINPYMKNAQVFIAPIRYGTGIRIKILDAISYGLPIVTTTEGANGLDVKNGKELLIAKDEKEFADKTIELLGNDTLQKKLVKNAYRFLKTNYSYKNLMDKLLILDKYFVHA